MLMVSVYRWRDDAHGKESAMAIMEAYGKAGNDPGMIAHYIFADGTGGVVIAETDDAASAYRSSLHMSEFLDLQASRSYSAVTLDEALGAVGEYLGG
jgi:hypothetical protein